ncbi:MULTISPECIES: acyl carrier protein [unclassified Cupriavidus]|uniref:Acyl carrier protein n=1 Tax=Cupriavidus pauculus TaxID=82633 RepID=A0A5P2H2W1_9BURK|nr:acyl carrier protein [Cupriavidus pauculus]QET01660.1 acyl carrier protein [Cupriavidus pauculus]
MKVALRNILSENACLHVPVETLADSDSLYDAGLSSLGTVRVLLAVEDAFGIEIPGELISFDLFRCIDSLERSLAPLMPDGSLAGAVSHRKGHQ